MNYIQKVLAVSRGEVKALVSSWYMLGFVTWIPLMGFALIVAIFFAGVPRELPVGVVDNDISQLSRMQLSNIESSATLSIKKQYNSVQEASHTLRDGTIYAVVIIPNHFEHDLRKGMQPTITVMLNTQFILMSKILHSSLTQVLRTSAATIDYVASLVDEERPELAKNAVNPIQIQITPFFNTYNNYFLFLVSAMLPALWSIFVVITLIIAYGEMFKNGGETAWLKRAEGSVSAAIMGKMLPYLLIQMAWGLGVVYFVHGVMPWPFAGSWLILASAMLLTIIVYQLIASAFYALKFEYASALSFGAVFTAPAFAAMGITFPLMNMGGVAVAWHELLPISHYIHIQISQANYGAPLSSIGTSFAALSLFLAVTPFVYWRFKVAAKGWVS